MKYHEEGIPEGFRKLFGPNLSGADFSRLYLNESIFHGVNPVWADFAGFYLNGWSIFDCIDLVGVDLSYIELSDVLKFSMRRNFR